MFFFQDTEEEWQTFLMISASLVLITALTFIFTAQGQVLEWAQVDDVTKDAIDFEDDVASDDDGSSSDSVVTARDSGRISSDATCHSIEDVPSSSSGRQTVLKRTASDERKQNRSTQNVAMPMVAQKYASLPRNWEKRQELFYPYNLMLLDKARNSMQHVHS